MAKVPGTARDDRNLALQGKKRWTIYFRTHALKVNVVWTIASAEEVGQRDAQEKNLASPLVEHPEVLIPRRGEA